MLFCSFTTNMDHKKSRNIKQYRTNRTGRSKDGTVNPKTIPSLGVMTLLDCLSDFPQDTCGKGATQSTCGQWHLVEREGITVGRKNHPTC